MSDRQREIFDRITEIRNQVGDLQAHLELLRTACEQLKEEKSEAIQRAERAEAKIEQFKELYGNLDKWQLTPDRKGNLLWMAKFGPGYAIEILNGTPKESSKEGEGGEVNHA